MTDFWLSPTGRPEAVVKGLRIRPGQRIGDVPQGRLMPNTVFESDRFASFFAMVAAGAGTSLAPEMAAMTAEGCRLLPLHAESFRTAGYAHVRRRCRRRKTLLSRG
jgi:DNA-binding transcriptional LysR family regulator